MNMILSLFLLFFMFVPTQSVCMWFGPWKFGGLKKYCRPSLQPQMEFLFVFVCGFGVCEHVCVCVLVGEKGEGREGERI